MRSGTLITPRKSISTGRRRATALVLAVWLASCAPSPQPLPPPGIVLQGLGVGDAGGGRIGVTGAAGSVTNEATSIEVVNLGTTSGAFAATRALVGSDGSFSLELPGVSTDELRLQAFGDNGRSPPIDVRGDGAGGVTDPQRLTCARVTPSELDFGEVAVGQLATRQLAVRNDCSGPLGFDVLTRFNTVGWDENAPVPIDMPIGGEVIVDVVFVPQQPGAQVNYLRLELNLGIRDLRPVTLIGAGI